MRSWRKTSYFFIVVLLAMTTPLIMSTSGRADVERKRVLMLHSFGLRFKPWTDHAQFIREEISRRRSVEFHDHSLVSARLAGDKSEGPFVDYLQALYSDKPPDIIVAIGAPAANFVQQHRGRLFPQAPMVFTVVQQLRVDHSKLTENDTVIASHNDNPSLFESVLQILPKTNTIAIVSGASANEKFWQEVIRREVLPRLAGRVQFKWYNEMSFEDILKDAANLPPHTVIFWQLMNVDAAGVSHEGPSALFRLAATANAPIFTHDDAFFGEAILGGPMQTRTEVAKTTAEVAVRILDGEKAGDIKTPPLPLSPPKYDWRLMQRFGISESDLPPGSTVFYKPPSPWETYRWPILSALTVLLFQAGLITLLLLERHRRQTAEMDSRQRMVELAHVNRFSTAGEMAASIAHEINQPLGAILNNTETAKIMLKSQYPNLKEMGEIVDDIQRDNSRATEVIGRLRNFMKKAPFERKNFDLNDQVAETVKFLSPEARSRDIALRSKPNGAPLPINGDPIQLQQVLSNLILNALDATSDTSEPEKAVTVATTRTGNFAEVSIADTGPGVSPEAAKKIFDPFFSTKDHGMGMGLSIVRTIVETHNGRIEVDNRNGEKGAVFRVKLPLA
jgi:signal transduction histidine kinase/ABC-type uncharacterized transport system substrate-binding protein